MGQREIQELYFVCQFYSSEGIAPANLVGAVEIVYKGQKECSLYRRQHAVLPLAFPALPVGVTGNANWFFQFRVDLKEPLGFGKELIS
jgi:hypothetical protein